MVDEDGDDDIEKGAKPKPKKKTSGDAVKGAEGVPDEAEKARKLYRSRSNLKDASGVVDTAAQRERSEQRQQTLEAAAADAAAAAEERARRLSVAAISPDLLTAKLLKAKAEHKATLAALFTAVVPELAAEELRTAKFFSLWRSASTVALCNHASSRPRADGAPDLLAAHGPAVGARHHQAVLEGRRAIPHEGSGEAEVQGPRPAGAWAG